MEVKIRANPIGNVLNNEYVTQFVEAMKTVWDRTAKTGASWQFWKKADLAAVTAFLTDCLDDLIAVVDEIADASGADKKATVLYAVEQIYTHIMRRALPIWLRPFARVIRRYVIYTLISSSIDWIVEKYRNGEWSKKPAVEVKAQLFGVPGGHRPKI